MRENIYFYLIILLFLFICQSESFPQNTAINWYTFDMGFAPLTSANTEVKSAVGQMFVGFSEQANMFVESGFLVDTLYREQVVSVDMDRIDKTPFIYTLNQNYPNPFNPSTTIEFDLPKTSNVTLKILDILGEEVGILVSDRLSAGTHLYEWDASNMASGVYLYRLSAGSLSGEAGEFVETKKMILMK